MANEQTEQKFRASLKELKKTGYSIWWWKLRSFMTPTPFDYVVLLKNIRLAVEIKQVKGKSFPFNRLEHHQIAGLTEFDYLSPLNHSFIFLRFYTLNRVFFIPFSLFRNLMNTHDKKSVNINYLLEHFKDFILEIKGGVYQFKFENYDKI